MRLLNESRVKYVVIGATAFPVHGYARATLDLDIFIDKALDNVKRVLRVLAEFGYDVSDLSETDVQTHKILIRQYALETDIHPFVTGVTFEQVWNNRVRSKVGETEAWFASLDDLIEMKKAAGRVKDLEDLKILEKIRDKQKQCR